MSARKVRILLVEDDPADARRIARALREAEGETTPLETAGTLAEGIVKARAGAFDVMLLDLALPDAGGLFTVRRAREALPDLAIVVLTATEDASLARRAVRAGAQDYLVKEKDGPEVVRRALRYAVERRAAARESERAIAGHYEELLRAKESLLAQNRIVQCVLDSISDGVVVADRDGNFLVFNAAGARISGVGALESSPERWARDFGVFRPDRRTLFATDELPLVRAIRGEGVDDVEMFLRNDKIPNGVYVTASGTPLRDEKGAILGGVVVF
ncbi:MAG: response regulator, partial [Planctomycetota bacterium]